MSNELCFSCETEITTPEYKCTLTGNGEIDGWELCQDCWVKTTEAIKTLEYSPLFLPEDLKLEATVNYATHYFKNLHK